MAFMVARSPIVHISVAIEMVNLLLIHSVFYVQAYLYILLNDLLLEYYQNLPKYSLLKPLYPVHDLLMLKIQ